MLSDKHHRQRPRLINVARPIRIVSQGFHLAGPNVFDPGIIAEIGTGSMNLNRFCAFEATLIRMDD